MTLSRTHHAHPASSPAASRPRWIIILAMMLLASACSYLTPATDANQSAETDDTGSVTTDTGAGNEPDDTPTSGPVTTLDLPDPVWQDLLLELAPMAEVAEPIAIASRSGSLDYFVAERAGRIRVISRTITEGAGLERISLSSRPALDLTEVVSTEGEGGLLGLQFSTDGRRLYVSYTDTAGDLVIAAYAASGSGQADVDSRRELLRIPQPQRNHNGGSIMLGTDGFLYIAVGDGGGAGDPDGNGQDTDTLLGSILRIDPEAVGDQPYGIPDGNPFVNGGGRPEIWAYGLRNPWQMAFDSRTGDLWLADVGQNEVEEINLLRAANGAGRGANLGWNEMEGDRPFEGGSAPPGHVAPVYAYEHDAGRCAVIGGRIYRGADMPLLDGVYLFGDLCTGEIFGLAVTPDGVVVRPLTISVPPSQLAGFGEGPDGELLVAVRDAGEGNGVVYRIEPRPGNSDG